MNTKAKHKFKKITLLLIAGFIALFILRLLYSYTEKETPIQFNQQLISETIWDVRKNYASKKHEIYSNTSAIPQTRIDQKYEKIAKISTNTADFNADENLIRKEIKKHKSLIQYENKSGNAGNRNLNFSIGVPPENFDVMYQSLIKIGVVSAKQITKTDKTNEYKELNAKKMSLEKIRTALLELKEKGGRIDEFMQLENRILEIEQQLQDLGVSLGNFDDENEFCTVQITLSEGSKIEYTNFSRIISALEWTIETYLKLMLALTFLALFAYLISLTIGKLKASQNQ